MAGIGGRRASRSTTSGRSTRRLPRREFAEPLYAGIAQDERAAQDFRDVFTRRVDPRSGLLTPERREQWFAAAGAEATA